MGDNLMHGGYHGNHGFFEDRSRKKTPLLAIEKSP